MPSQLFKKDVPLSILNDLLSIVCEKNNDGYVFNNQSYKKVIFHQLEQDFINNCRPHYHASKLRYLDRKMNYNHFVTILRQIAKLHNITYTSNIKYSKSNYCIEYLFCFT